MTAPAPQNVRVVLSEYGDACVQWEDGVRRWHVWCDRETLAHKETIYKNPIDDKAARRTRTIKSGAFTKAGAATIAAVFAIVRRDNLRDAAEKALQAQHDEQEARNAASRVLHRKEAAAADLYAAVRTAREAIDVSVIRQTAAAEAHWSRVATVLDAALAKVDAA